MNETLPHVTIASIPRCGSTYLVRSILGREQGQFTPKNFRAFQLEKVHRFIEPQPDTRVVFLFGDPVAAVVSTMVNRATPGHFAACGASWPPQGSLLDHDLLGYGDMWNRWTSHPGVLCVRYDALKAPKAREIIEEWIRRPVKWLPWRERTTKVSNPTRSRIENTYWRLISQIKSSPSIFQT